MYVPWTTWNENEKRQWCLIYFICKYSEEDCSSRGELTDVIKYADVCVVQSVGFTLPSLTREVRTTEDASPKFAYLVLRNARRHNVTSPDNLPNLLGTLDHDGNADTNWSVGKTYSGTYCSWDIRSQEFHSPRHMCCGDVTIKKVIWFVPDNFGGKAAYVSQN